MQPNQLCRLQDGLFVDRQGHSRVFCIIFGAFCWGSRGRPRTYGGLAYPFPAVGLAWPGSHCCCCCCATLGAAAGGAAEASSRLPESGGGKKVVPAPCSIPGWR